MIDELKVDLENIVMEAIAEWESENHFIANYKFEILGFEIIREDLNCQKEATK